MTSETKTPEGPEAKKNAGEKGNPTNEHEIVTPIIRAVENIAQAVLSKTQANHDQQHADEDRNYRLARTAVYGTLAYTLITGPILVVNWCLVRTSTEQAAIANESMRVSQRPYIELGQSGPDNPVASWNIQGEERVGLFIYLQNAGATPAKRVYANGKFLPGEMTFHHLEMQPQPAKLASPSVGQIYERAKNATTWTSGPVIAAHDTQRVLVNNIGPIEIKKAMAKGQSGQITLLGDFEYTNIFDEYCCESFCLKVAQSGIIGICNPPPPRFIVCPKMMANVCEQKGELKGE